MLHPDKPLARLRAMMAAGEWRKALALAAKWPELGAHRDAIQMAASAAANPRFYESLGKDPAVLAADGRIALIARYGSPCPGCGDWCEPGEICDPCFEANGFGCPEE